MALLKSHPRFDESLHVDTGFTFYTRLLALKRLLPQLSENICFLFGAATLDIIYCTLVNIS